MKNMNLLLNAKTLSYTLFGITLLHGATSYAAVSQSPLSLTVGVPPNMLLTLDSSGSMRWAFAPDGISGTGPTRRGKSNAFNPIYYNPLASYPTPVTFNSSGAEVRQPQEFTNARVNGYKSDLGTVDLSTDYKVNWTYAVNTGLPTAYGISNNDNRLAKNAEADFSLTVSVDNNGSTVTQRNAASNITFKVRRADTWGGSSCTASASHPNWSGEITADCSWQGSTRYKASLEERGVPAYYYTYNSSQSGCTTATESCYSLQFITTDSQKSNFANWYSFYRNRALATISAANVAFYNLSPTVRLSWQTLSVTCGEFDGRGRNCNNKFQSFSDDHKRALYNWMQDIAFSGGTPLPGAMMRAGDFFKTATPWQKTPFGDDNTDANTYSCRASYHIVMTDGVWDTPVSPTGTYRQDSSTFTLPDTKEYTGQAPFRDGTDQTLADLAMHYWATDLRSGLNNKVPAYIPFKSGNDTTDFWDPRNDPATWQHMTNFVMGLGLTQSLSVNGLPWEGSTHAGAGYNALKRGTASWPAANNATGKVYDLWHAAINSRGDFFSVDSPEAMVQAFADILSRIADRKSTAARPAINSGQVADEEVKTVSYQTSYASDDNWSGDLKRIDKTWDPETSSIVTDEVWSAKEQVPASRTIKIAGSGASGLANFNWDAANTSSYAGTTLRSYLGINPETGTADNRGEARLNYLRGSRTGEGTTFRTRSGLLADFYSSTPAVVSGARYVPSVANKLDGTDNSYTAFKASIANRAARVYVGGNAGMLHAFNATTGVEEFAFIPSAVFPKLNKLTGSNYSHEFYVEGSPVIADVYDTTASTWKTILVGTLKAGGKSVFALDITTPGSEKLLWQFNENTITDNDRVKMGYSFSQPTIARLHNGKWAVVFGNGYESAGNTNGKAALFILDAMQGTLLRSLEVQGTNGVANGLSTPKLADMNGDGVADYAYAGDLQGNMWRFDLLRPAATRDETNPFIVTNDVPSSAFRVGYDGRPLFTATAGNSSTVRQAITAPPSLIRHPTGTGYLVVFGTGRFFDVGDKEGNKTIAQSMYGIWDKQTRGETGTNGTVARTTLQAQTMTTGLTGTDGTTSRDARIISNNSVNWFETTNAQGATVAAQNGWYLNLVQSDGEMVVENMAQLGNTLFAQTLVPNSDPCGTGASNWTYAINPFSGGRTAHNAFDYKATGDDLATDNVSAIKQDGEGGGTLAQNPDGGFQFCTGQECVNIYPDPTSIGRQSWRRVDEQESN